MVFPIAGGNESKGYDVENSLRFNDDDSASLTKTFSGDGDRRTFTWSGWVKKGNHGINEILFAAADTDNTPQTIFNFDSADRLSFFDSTSSAEVNTSNLFRDSSAWYHIVLAVDTTQSTNSNRVKIYVNGVEVSYNSTSYPNQNVEFSINDASYEHEIGGRPANTIYFDGYMTEINFIDGAAKAQTDFGEFDDNGVWIPKRYTGTYGNNGFFLQFKQTGTSQNSSGIGADTSGNDNHFAVNNLAATDVTTDTCTNNYCTLNSIRGAIGSDSSNSTLSEGNLKSTGNNGDYKQCEGTIFPESGKWYWETLIVSDGSDAGAIGIQRSGLAIGAYPGKTANGYGYDSNGSGSKIHNNSRDTSYGSSFAANDIIGTLLDLDNGTLTFYKNNSSQGQAYSGITSSLGWGFGFGDAYGTVIVVNFGQEGSFAGNKTASGNSDANGYGDFFYSVPSGYYALNTKNLAEFG